MPAPGARWIRIGRAAPERLSAGAEAFAAVQPAAAAPAVLWAQGETLRFHYALIVPRRLAPGRAARWAAWALAPALATYRHLGVPAYSNAGEVWLHGRRIDGVAASAVGECAVLVSGFVLRLAADADGAQGRADAFRDWLRGGLSLAASEWGAAGAPHERALEDAFRARLAAQYGWSFEHDWPRGDEADALALAREPSPEPESVTG